VDSDRVAVLRRWEDSGALWRVLELDADRATVGLFTCDGGEEVGRLLCEEPELVRFLSVRRGNDDGSRSPWPTS
jgi:hypothetical protein